MKKKFDIVSSLSCSDGTVLCGVYYQFISRCRNIKVLRVIKTFYGENVSEYLHADAVNLTLHLQIGQLVDEDFKLFI